MSLFNVCSRWQVPRCSRGETIPRRRSSWITFTSTASTYSSNPSSIFPSSDRFQVRVLALALESLLTSFQSSVLLQHSCARSCPSLPTYISLSSIPPCPLYHPPLLVTVHLQPLTLCYLFELFLSLCSSPSLYLSCPPLTSIPLATRRLPS